MKKIILIFALPVIFMLSGCGNAPNEYSENKEAITQPSRVTEIDLSSYGMNLAITVPDTIKDKLVLTKISDMQLNGEIGEYGFTIFLNEISEDENLSTEIKAHMDTTKAGIVRDPDNKFKRYLVEEPNAIFWESEEHGTEYHFCVILTEGKTIYYEVLSNGSMESEKLQKTILEYVKTLKPKAAAKAS